jgi:signal transduction histidine kinase
MKTAQSRTLFTTVMIFMLALLILGGALQFLLEDYLTDSTFQRLDRDSQVLSHLVSAYNADPSMDSAQFLINLDLTAQASGIDVLICDAGGRIILSSQRTELLNQQGLGLSPEYLQQIAVGGMHFTGQLQGIYAQSRHISARAVFAYSGGPVVAYVLASVPVAETRQVLEGISNIFATGAIAVMVVSVLAMAIFSRQQSFPMQEMARKARAFGHGDLDARVKITGSQSREVEELAIAFNNMASSLQKSEYSRQEFVANVSHELKTPMTTIGGYIDGILDGTIPPERQRHYMQIVSDETKRLSRLVRSMLDISQLQSEGGIPAEKMSRFDVCECAGQMLITFEQKIMSKNLQVEVDFPECPSYTVAQQDYISQVVYNLLDNAVKFCPQEGVLSLKIREGESKIYVSVGNTGQTIPPEEISLLFDRFHKIDKSRGQNRDGWGLGLYIVKTIVGLHGEDISVTSLEGKTEFTFTLPLMN